jgi:hypothetical protein
MPGWRFLREQLCAGLRELHIDPGSMDCNRLWGWLLKGQKFEKDPYSLSTFEIGDALAMRMKHPSTGFSSERWHAVLQEHLPRSRQRRA